MLESLRRENWDKLLEPAVASGSTKPGSDAYNRSLEERQQKRRDLAHTLPLAGSVVSAVILDASGHPLWQSTGQGSPGKELIDQLHTKLTPTLQHAEGSFGNRFVLPLLLLGYEIRDRLAVAYLDWCLETGDKSAFRYSHYLLRPTRDIGHGSQTLMDDPYEAAMSTDQRSQISRETLHKALGSRDYVAADMHSNALYQAQQTFWLSRRLGLI